jgi:hypothetical protein
MRELLDRLDSLGRSVAALRSDVHLLLADASSDRPDSGSEIPVIDAIFAIDDRRGLELTGEEVDVIADVGLDAFERGIEGRDLEAVVASVVDQVVAGRVHHPN